MPGESQLPPTSAPDPTVATNDAVARGDEAERDYVNGQLDVIRERLRGIDRATELLNESVNRVPTDVQQAVGNLEALTDEKFASVQTQFAERDTRSERETRDNTIKVDAAFAASEKIAAKQDEANAKSIEKSEKATEKVIDALNAKIDDLKDRLIAIEANKVGASGRDDRLLVVAGVIIAALAVYFGTR